MESSPYGINKRKDNYIALAMTHIVRLAELLQCEPLKNFINPDEWFNERDEIKKILVRHLITNTAAYWLAILEKADVWFAPVLDYYTLVKEEGY